MLGKHAEPVEQSGPGKTNCERIDIIFRFYSSGLCKSRTHTHTETEGYLLLDRHLLGGAGWLDRHGGLERDSGGGVSACFGGLHGAWRAQMVRRCKSCHSVPKTEAMSQQVDMK